MPTCWPMIKKIDIDINIEIQFGERVGHGGWLIGPKLFRPKAYLICVSSKLSELIFQLTNFTPAPQVMSYDHKTEKKEIQ